MVQNGDENLYGKIEFWLHETTDMGEMDEKFAFYSGRPSE
jgi:hypothetical protein